MLSARTFSIFHTLQVCKFSVSHTKRIKIIFDKIRGKNVVNLYLFSKDPIVTCVTLR